LTSNSIDFNLDPLYVDTKIVKRIGIDLASNSIAVEINQHLILQTVHLYDFSDKTIKPLKKQLNDVLRDNKKKRDVINSIVTCVNRNIEIIISLVVHSHGPSSAQILVELASDPQNVELFFANQHGKPYMAARLGSDRHLEIMPLESSKCKFYLAKLFRGYTGRVPGKDAINNAINSLASKAVFDGQTIPLHLRVACGSPANRSKPDCIYYDMTDAQGRIIEISTGGWRIIRGTDANVPILFKRHNQMPQAEPDINYESDIFDRFLSLTNVKKEHRQLVKVYIVSLLIPDIAHAILNIHGPKGAAKSFLLRLIKMLIDPSRPILLSLHKDMREFIQQVSHNYLAFYDNVKYISQDLSDEICRCVTGSGSTKRELYTDDEDIVYEYKHCLSLNGINIALTESDALDRGLMIDLEEINDENRKKESDLLAEFEAMRPKVLPYILDIVVKAMQIKRTLHLPALTRMADFSEWGEAISRAIGYDKMSFIRALYENRREQNTVAVEESIVGFILVKFWQDYYKHTCSTYEWSPAQLYAAIVEFAGSNDININNRQFPKTPAVLVKKLNVIKPNLKEAYGIVVQVGRDSNNNSVITIHDGAGNASPTCSLITKNQVYALQVLQRQISSAANRGQ
jgi:hypothetical protein